jgi:hypothetical protein
MVRVAASVQKKWKIFLKKETYKKDIHINQFSKIASKW